eukprot:TRINITY_DN16014_c0_g1_i1.p1 TRINITY_DN16014_c0_g1~~TRINITY_DN16014_c0_g1_i1.p1  ORF type:complete len:295 (-),score=29.23 TRINITY_DN16014_c0_g1_i1:288-1085(-)
MVVLQRIDWLLSQLHSGASASLHVSYNMALSRTKVSFKLFKSGSNTFSPVITGMIRMVRQHELSTVARVWDGGHRHSNGVQHVTFWIAHAGTVPPGLDGTTDHVNVFDNENGSDHEDGVDNEYMPGHGYDSVHGHNYRRAGQTSCHMGTESDTAHERAKSLLADLEKELAGLADAVAGTEQLDTCRRVTNSAGEAFEASHCVDDGGEESEHHRSSEHRQDFERHQDAEGFRGAEYSEEQQKERAKQAIMAQLQLQLAEIEQFVPT